MTFNESPSMTLNSVAVETDFETESVELACPVIAISLSFPRRLMTTITVKAVIAATGSQTVRTSFTRWNFLA